MKKYVICVDNGSDFNAATKARQDAEQIMAEAGYERICFRGEKSADGKILKQISSIRITADNWRKLEKQIDQDSMVVLQYPLFPIKTAYMMNRLLPRVRSRKRARFIAVIHDLNSLRDKFGKSAIYSDNIFLRQFDCIICHNKRMKEYLYYEGFEEQKLIELGLFDYLTNEKPAEHHPADGITIAGNLDPGKCGYIKQLAECLNGKMPLHLYGKGGEEKPEMAGMIHHGALPADELPGKMEGGFGLVWDGPEAKSCTGGSGEYLRYNNPHKFSLYLASGLPIIIWNEAALAGFVREKQIGICVDQLDHLNDMLRDLSPTSYEQMQQNARRIGKTLRQGEYLKSALLRAEGSGN